MSGDTEIEDPEISDSPSENGDSDHEQEIEKEDDNTDMAEQKFRPETDEDEKGARSTVTTKPKLDPKDPLRPRRKKARRACFACQRAHLTCGMFTLFGLLSFFERPLLPSPKSLYLCHAIFKIA